ncbi:MAG TPA: redoxin family protein, partial [Acidimicrobiales bacterium]|nr:redoxin family protein [Acidimicrobiales bacterium]
MTRGTAGVASSPALALGDVAPVFHASWALMGVDGRRYSLSSFDEHPVVALVFVGNGCPSVKAYAEELNRLHRLYGPRGVQLVAVNANNASLSPSDTLPQMIQAARERRW